MRSSWLIMLVIAGCQSGTGTKFGAEKYLESVVSTVEWEENCISFTTDEKTIFLTRGNDWQKQIGYLIHLDNEKNTMRSLLTELDTVYNGAISPSGTRLIFTRRLETETQIWLAQLNESKPADLVNLTSTSGIEGGYFHWYNEDTLFFHVNNDLVRGTLTEDRLIINEMLETFNSIEGTEFSPFMGKEYKYFIFTRYTEGNEDDQGFFISYNRGSMSKPRWSEPKRIDNLPYGWGTFVSGDENWFYYTDGLDIYRVSVSDLGLNI